MIDIEYAIKSFEKYVNNYDTSNEKVKLKIIHTYGGMDISEYIAKELNLSNEEIKLAKLIGLLHDIGRFEQLKKFDNFYDGLNNVDHAKMGVEILFDNDNLIREFIIDDKYDNIIFKAIINHNKYKIEDGLDDKELLHVKIIRDADKTDNFRVNEEENFYSILNFKKEELEEEYISEEVYQDFINNKMILDSKRKTSLDIWLSHLAYMHDYNFNPGLKYIYEKDYINKIINRMFFKNDYAKIQIENIRKHANKYLKEKLSL